MCGSPLVFVLGCLFLFVGGWRANNCHTEFMLRTRPLYYYLIEGLFVLGLVGFGFVFIVAAIESFHP